MDKTSFRLASTLTAWTACVTFSTWASAQQPGTSVPTPAPTPTPPVLSVQTTTPEPPVVGPVVATSEEPVIDPATTRKTLPNRPLLVTGTVVLAGTYGASAIIGALSDRDADKKLYYPVVGPWMDLNHRGCDVNACANNTLDRVLLVGDGVLQGLGALGMLLSLAVPEKTTHSWYLIGNSEVIVVPHLASSMMGVSATGRF